MEDFVGSLIEGGGTMLETIMGYVSEFATQVGSVIVDKNLQPFLLIPTGLGVFGAIVSQAKRITRIGGGRRR